MSELDYPDCVYCGERIYHVSVEGNFVVYHCVCEWESLRTPIEIED